MTDNEIIKALECRIDSFSKSVLDLINRQKTEIECLESRIFALNDTNKMLMDSQEIYWKNKVKEFAERLKDELRLDDDCGYHCFDCCYECKDYVPVVDNLVKEMTEVSE